MSPMSLLSGNHADWGYELIRPDSQTEKVPIVIVEEVYLLSTDQRLNGIGNQNERQWLPPAPTCLSGVPFPCG